MRHYLWGWSGEVERMPFWLYQSDWHNLAWMNHWMWTVFQDKDASVPHINHHRSMWIQTFILCPPLLKITTLVLDRLIVSCHFAQYLLRRFKQFCNPSSDSDNRTTSSANIRQFNFSLLMETGAQDSSNISGKSDKYKLNKIGLSTQPCLTPTVDENGVEYVPLTLTLLYIGIHVLENSKGVASYIGL